MEMVWRDVLFWYLSGTNKEEYPSSWLTGRDRTVTNIGTNFQRKTSNFSHKSYQYKIAPKGKRIMNVHCNGITKLCLHTEVNGVREQTTSAK